MASSKELTQLYRHYDADGELLYVGISLSAVSRLSKHRKSPWFQDIATITVENHDSRLDAEQAERTAIKIERPKHNVVHAESRPSYKFMDLVMDCIENRRLESALLLRRLFPRDLLRCEVLEQFYDIAVYAAGDSKILRITENDRD